MFVSAGLARVCHGIETACYSMQIYELGITAGRHDECLRRVRNMPIKDRKEFLAYQRAYNKMRKEQNQGCKNLYPGSSIVRSRPPKTSTEQQVTANRTSRMPGCKPSAPAYIPHIPVTATPKIGTVISSDRVGAPPKPTNAKKTGSPASTQTHKAKAVKEPDFHQLRIKQPITTVGTVGRWRSLQEIAEALTAGDPVTGEELIRIRAVGAKV